MNGDCDSLFDDSQCRGNRHIGLIILDKTNYAQMSDNRMNN